jgi:hypothetical protein
MSTQSTMALCAHGRRRRDICGAQADEPQAARQRRRDAGHPDRTADECLDRVQPTHSNVEEGLCVGSCDQIRGVGGTDAHEGVSTGGHHMEDLAVYVKLACLVDLGNLASVDHRLDGQRRPRGTARRIGASRAPGTNQETKPGQAKDELAPSASEFSDCIAGRTATRVNRLDDTHDDQEAQSLGEQVGANARQSVQQLVITPRSQQQPPNDEQRPPLAYHAEPVCQPTFLVMTPALPPQVLQLHAPIPTAPSLSHSAVVQLTPRRPS